LTEFPCTVTSTRRLPWVLEARKRFSFAEPPGVRTRTLDTEPCRTFTFPVTGPDFQSRAIDCFIICNLPKQGWKRKCDNAELMRMRSFLPVVSIPVFFASKSDDTLAALEILCPNLQVGISQSK
jgi:hypothetical protein